MLTTGSNDISSLEVQVTFDISGTNPFISLVNLSTGMALENVKWWFVATSPTNHPIHTGSIDNVDLEGEWEHYDIVNAWPKPNYQIEWSGAPYSVTIYAQDSDGKRFSITKNAMIKKPSGNTDNSKNTYGVGNIYVKVICEQGRVFFEDRTAVTYRGLEGSRIDSVITMSYPIDDSGVAIKPFRLSPFSKVMVPITYSSDMYVFAAFSIYEYDLGENIKIRIRYAQKRSFQVRCNLDLAELTGSILKLHKEVEQGKCENMQEAHKKLTLITSKFALVIAGKIEPLSDIAVEDLIEEIKALGGFTCDCYRSSGIIPTSASIVDGYVFDVVHVGGDIQGLVVPEGPNIHIRLWDTSYVIALHPESQSAALDITIPAPVDQYTKTFYLKIDNAILAEELAATIKNSAYLLNIWQELFAESSTFNLTVDGNKIFQSTSTCNYNFVLNNIPASGTFAVLSSIKVGAIVKPLVFPFNLGNIAALQTYLNSLGLGTFEVTVPSPNAGNDIYISTQANSNSLDALTFRISGTSNSADMAKECTGYVPISANEVVQRIIDYVSDLNDTQITNSSDRVIRYVDPKGEIQEITVAAGKSLDDVIKALLEAGNTSVSFLHGNKGGASCDALQGIFKPNAAAIDANTLLYGSKGDCAGMTPLEVFNYVLKEVPNNSTTKELFCQVVSLCGQGQVCEAFNYVEPFVTVYSTSCTEIQGIEYTLS